MRLPAALIGIATAGLMLLTGTSTVAATLRVSGTGTGCRNARFTSIQNAVDAARPNDTIIVCAGIYDEQLVVDKQLRVRGKGGAIVRPSSMAANTTSLRTGEPIASVIAITARVKLSGLEIDASANGLGCTVGDPNLIGVFFRGVSGSLKESNVHGTRLGEADLSCESGAAVFVQGGTGTIKVSLLDNRIYDYQRAGIVVNETGARATIRGNIVTGLGSTPELAQNGIQVGFGGFAKITQNVVQNNATPTEDTCTFDGGNLVFQADGGVISNNTFTGNTAGVFISGSGNRIKKNHLNGLSGGVPAGLDGILLVGHSNVVFRNVINDMSATGIRVLGNGNHVTRNTVVGTRAANLCDSLSTTAGCEDVLDVCGVGVRIVQGSANIVAMNTLVSNDVDVLDEALSTKVRRIKKQ
jgi:parallel beta-helix repeat protein